MKKILLTILTSILLIACSTQDESVRHKNLKENFEKVVTNLFDTFEEEQLIIGREVEDDSGGYYYFEVNNLDYFVSYGKTKIDGYTTYNITTNLSSNPEQNAEVFKYFYEKLLEENKLSDKINEYISEHTMKGFSEKGSNYTIRILSITRNDTLTMLINVK